MAEDFELHYLCIYKCRRCGATFIKSVSYDTVPSPEHEWHLTASHFCDKSNVRPIGVGDLLGYDLVEIHVMTPIEVKKAVG